MSVGEKLERAAAAVISAMSLADRIAAWWAKRQATKAEEALRRAVEKQKRDELALRAKVQAKADADVKRIEAAARRIQANLDRHAKIVAKYTKQGQL